MGQENWLEFIKFTYIILLFSFILNFLFLNRRDVIRTLKYGVLQQILMEGILLMF
jgi:hypothetical protein